MMMLRTRSDRPIFSAAEVDVLRGQLKNAAARQVLRRVDLDALIENRIIDISTEAGVYLGYHRVGEIRNTKARDLSQQKLAQALTKFADAIEQWPGDAKEAVWWIDYLTKKDPAAARAADMQYGVDGVAAILRRSAKNWSVIRRTGPKATQTNLRHFVQTLVNTWTFLTGSKPGMSTKADTVYQFVFTVLEFVNARISGTRITNNQIENALKSAIQRSK